MLFSLLLLGCLQPLRPPSLDDEAALPSPTPEVPTPSDTEADSDADADADTDTDTDADTDTDTDADADTDTDADADADADPSCDASPDIPRLGGVVQDQPDLHAFEVGSGDRFQVTVGADTTLDLQLLAPDGSWLATGAGAGGTSILEWTNPSNASRNVELMVANPTPTCATYLMDADVVDLCWDEATEPNDALGQAPLLPVFPGQRGLTADSTEDWYTMWNSGVVRYTIDFDPSLGDIDLQLTDADGNVLDTSEGTGAQEVVEYDVGGFGGLSIMELKIRVYLYQPESDACTVYFLTAS